MIHCKRFSVVLCAGALMLLAAGLPSFAAADAAASGYSAVVPEGEKAVMLSISGNQVPYYQLSKSGELKIKVEGPADLKVFSRLSYPAGANGAQKYTLEISDNGKPLRTQSSAAERSQGVFPELGVAAGMSRKLTLHIPRGSHTLGFRLKETSAPGVFLRVLYHSRAATAKLSLLTPLAYSRVVTASVNESLIAYFVATKDREVKLRVIGPLTLRVESRLNYDSRMIGDQKYGIVMTENGKTVRTVPLLAQRSTAVTYKDWADVVPGKLKTFTFNVPAGEHTYSFLLEQGIPQSVSLRFQIPEASTRN